MAARLAEAGPAPAAASCGARPRVLCCLWGELRGVRVTAESVRERLLVPLGADAAVVAQRQLPDDDERLAVLREAWGSRLVLARLYDKPEPRAFFGGDCYEQMSRVRGNWLNRGNTQVLINHKVLGDLLSAEGLLQQYDAFVFTRSDLLHVAPFPTSPELFAALGPTDVLTQAGHEFGGVNYNLAVLRGEIAGEYLAAPCRAVAAKAVAGGGSQTWNIERFIKSLIVERGWRNPRMSITCFITAESLGDRSTWRSVRSCARHPGVLYKYESQMVEAHRSAERWGRRPQWACLRPPRPLQVEENHGRAVRPFALALAEEVACAAVARQDRERHQAAAGPPRPALAAEEPSPGPRAAEPQGAAACLARPGFWPSFLLLRAARGSGARESGQAH